MNWSPNANEVHLNSIWREHLKKERTNQTSNNSFQFHPNSITVLSEKPAIALRPERISGDIIDEECRQMLSTVANLHKPPNARLSFPATSAQEIGWSAMGKQKSSPTAYNSNFKQQSCDETKFAATYIFSLKESPFQVDKHKKPA
mmetsp:Transcript_12507/g.21114  ORF Transcript_12507/g.21114 Transcript_12507/m.21114 type:complete len:145 (-) Transcript_12507:278-712(-)|eukprot:CAMPEP_0184353848 /NCGR_PEP_ID=MMETSP1089-20130417/83089_1 /TAXON_ID=38269 ORGANISM="Gloeochaete wittrockiana, Strain SAG46.84" /NCGR_SAMPLE_ID=MMETSP1089 /ASSEMBLY_ACC=CAM_ASM_000445 /LENGTH=144 /DNA_ID=CAMNT_0026689533 /DNA_START=64 /DNA_END=498 /DNA_ORIENTATION=+